VTASVFVPNCAKPAAVGLDDDACGEKDDKDNVIVVPGFGIFASASRTGAGRAWWNSARRTVVSVLT
jgi:hypothetical protein